MTEQFRLEPLHSSILDAIADAVTAQDYSGRLIYANQVYARLLGFASPEVLLTMPLEEVMRAVDLWDGNGQVFPPEQLPGRLALAGKPCPPVILRMRNAHNSEYWLIASAKPVYTDTGNVAYVVSTFRDITDTKQAQLNQRLSDERLELLVEQMPAVFWSVDVNLRFTMGIGAGLRLLGLKINDLSGMSLQEYFGVDDPEFPPLQAARRALQGETVRFEMEWNDMIFQSHVEPLRNPNDGIIIGVVGVGLDVTEQRYMEHALRQREGQFRRLAESSTVGLIIADEQNRIIYANPAFQTMLGYTESEFSENTIRWADFTPPDYAARDAQAVHELLTTGRCTPYEKAFQAKDGRHVPVLVGATVLFDMFGERFTVAAFITDLTLTKQSQAEQARLLTEQRRERERVERRAELLQQLSRSLAKALSSADVASIIIERGAGALDAAFATVGLVREEEATFQLLASSAPLQLRARFENMPLARRSALTDAIRSGLPVWIERHEDYEASYPELGGLVRRVAGSKSAVALPLIAEDRVIGGLSISFASYRSFNQEDRDFLLTLAHQCALALERARLYDAERSAREAAQRANDLKTQFLGMISHELRTPLTSIKGFASTLLANDVHFSAAQQRDFLTVIDEESDKLTELVDQLLDLTSIHAGTLRIQPEAQPLSAIIQAANRELTALTSGHRFSTQIPADLPLLHADRYRTIQIITNLVHNAAKFSPPGTDIVLSARLIDQTVQIAVSDQGVGIADRDRLIVFEAFRQLVTSRGERRGAGLGLAICKALVEAHGGQIWVDDRPPPGTTIAFTLPAVLPG